jgi:hypothetical protein
MILAALGPLGVVAWIFLATVFPSRTRATTQAERELVAGTAREYRRLVGIALLGLLLPLLVVAVLHLWDTGWMPLELS